MRKRQNSRRIFLWFFSLVFFLVLLWLLIGLDGARIIAMNVHPDYFIKAEERRKIVKSKQSLIDEQQALQQQVSELSANLSVLKEEVEILSEMLNIDSYWTGYPNLEGEHARIIFKDHYGLFDTMLVDKGSNQGIRKNMVVLGKHAIIGRVISVKPEYSRIRTINNPNLSFGVHVERTRELGLISGGRTELSLTYISINSTITLGDTIITSGTTDITPPGLPVGMVKEVIRYEPEQRISVKVESPEDLQNLHAVWIVTSTRPVVEEAFTEEAINDAD